MVEIISSLDKLLNLDIIYAHIFCEKSSVEQEIDGMRGFAILQVLTDHSNSTVRTGATNIIIKHQNYD